MYHVHRCDLVILLHTIGFSLFFYESTFALDYKIESRILHVGEELWKETLQLKMGSQLYQLEGLKLYTWYEVKILYPASGVIFFVERQIPSSFSIQLKRGVSDLGLKWNRRLLNTEKLIFKTDGLELPADQGQLYVLVTVEPEGVVAIPNVQERQYIIFNIVCDELLLGIPYNAWWVVILGLLCLGLAFIIPRFLPSHLLSRNEDQHGITSKNS